MDNMPNIRTRRGKLVHTRFPSADLAVVKEAARRIDAPVAEIVRAGSIRLARELIATTPADSTP